MTTTMPPPAKRSLSPATTAALATECPACGAGPSKWCVTATGGRASRLHDQRSQLAAPPRGAAWAAERDQLTARLKGVADRAADLTWRLDNADASRRAAEAERDDLAAKLSTARHACEAGAARIGDLERQIREAAAARPVVIKAGWERDLARRYLAAKYREVPAAGLLNAAERWVAAMAAGDKAQAESLMGFVESQWARIHERCA